MNLGDFLTLVLGGGAVATVGAVFKGVQALRVGARSREREALDDLEKWRVLAVRRAEAAELELEYWRDYASECRFLLRENGLQAPALRVAEAPVREVTRGPDGGPPV